MMGSAERGPRRQAATQKPPTTVEQLRQAIAHRGSHRERPAEVVSTGFPQLDRLLPQGGLLPGQLVEWRGDPGSGAGRLAWRAACRWLERGGLLAAIDLKNHGFPPAHCFPPAWWSGPIAGQVAWQDIVWIRPATLSEMWLAWEESLRSPGVAAVWGFVPRLPLRHHRRWQLACETGGHVGMLIRPRPQSSTPCWSSVVWDVRPQASELDAPITCRRWHVRLAGGKHSGCGARDSECELRG